MQEHMKTKLKQAVMLAYERGLIGPEKVREMILRWGLEDA
jgi:hypothetical protein